MNRPFHLMTKPGGAVCNLDCVYCYYLEKQALYPDTPRAVMRMPDEVLESYVRQYLASQPGPEVTFAWQGGEPTLLGLPFFERALALQRQYRGHKTVLNSLQTNGTLLDDAWGRFLQEHGFLVGLSVDGPADLHDRLRVDRGGAPTHARVLRGAEVLRRHGVAFNLLCTVNAHNVTEPLRVYRYLKTLGTAHLQFIPVVERVGTDVTAHSVPAAAFGTFLNAVFDEWIRQDVGRVFVQTFESALSAHLGFGPTMCVFSPTCGSQLALEHSGDVFSCDHFVTPEDRLGNLMELPLLALVGGEAQRQFGQAKRGTLHAQCRRCPVLFACGGDCPKHRFVAPDADGHALSYLCSDYLAFFTHAAPSLERMAGNLRAGRPVADGVPG